MYTQPNQIFDKTQYSVTVYRTIKCIFDKMHEKLMLIYYM